MNMYEFSEKNNWEMGVLFEKAKVQMNIVRYMKR